MAALRIELFGGFRVAVGDVPVRDELWARRRPATVLKLLALAPGHRLQRITATALAQQREDDDPPLVVDIRTEREWRKQRIAASVSLPLPRLEERSHKLPTYARVVVHCATGYRSAIAASLLLRHRLESVRDLAGGFAAWASCGLDTPTSGGR